eukprot:TRINITY_DN43037_c0_g1_i1.p2 TRINITY_DN43037_c0_g1~~TRINITY_DN43037_c0_g1_i1.p2  ORF type:complete len:217 (+),score=54.27 TRINITY_DN43037_c0_g1_i1:71-721(+)
MPGRKRQAEVGIPNEIDYNKYPQLAVADLFNACCCLWAAARCYPASREAAAGMCMVGIASLVGFGRFGFSPRIFKKANDFLADMGGMVGIPLIGLGYLSRIAGMHVLAGHYTQYRLETIGALVGVGLLCALILSHNAKELYTTLGSAAAMGAVVARTSFRFQGSDKVKWAYAAVGIFLVGGALIGPKRHQYLLGIRKETIFLVSLGVSITLMAMAI